ISRKTRKAVLYDPLLEPLPLSVDTAPRLFPTPVANAEVLSDAPPATLAENSHYAMPVETVISPVSATAPIAPVKVPDRSEEPVFRSAARLVLVDLVAKGKGSRTVPLTGGDFTLLDDGKPQKIALFSAAPTLVSGVHAAGLAAAISNQLQPDGAVP